MARTANSKPVNSGGTSGKVTFIFQLIYRLALPGGVLLLATTVMLWAGVFSDSAAPLVRFYPWFVFAAGLGLSAAFKRSRLFFALLTIMLAELALDWLPASHRGVFDAVSLLVPLNFIVFFFWRDRGIVSPAGKRRLVFIAVQICAIVFISMPSQVYAATLLDRNFVVERLSGWSKISQLSLAAFLLVVVVMMIVLARRRRPQESGLLWALLTIFVALQAGKHAASIYFASAGLVVIAAVLETSYAMAYYDELTRLPARRALNEALLKLGDSFTIAMLDVDHFKKFNDSYGHETGDQVLRMVGSKLAHIAGGGKAFRYGGEEFAVLFPGKGVDEVFPYLDRMRTIIEQSRFTVRGPERRSNGKKRWNKRNTKQLETNVTVSVGLAGPTENNSTPEQVIQLADKALYRAKSRGRNCTVIAKPSTPRDRILSLSN
jgi:diguanylate cyclase (GGDEF)-like protein